VISVLALAAVVWTFWRPRDHILSTALLLTAIFLFSPYALNYDFVVLAWVVTLTRQRPDNNRFDHALILALWTLPVTMMIAGLAKIPLGFLVLAGFGARILQRLAQSEAFGAPACTAGGVIPIRST
jgi:alpha-1,2-mannosyltransferase